MQTRSPRRRWPLDVLSVGALFALPYAVHWAMWSPHPLDRLVLKGDSLVQAFPTRVLVDRLLRSGELPLWNPYQLGGMPIVGDVQTAVFYLPNLLYTWVSSLLGMPITYMTFEALVIAHVALGGIFLYAFLRGLGVARGPALVGAVALELSGFFVGHRGHYNMLAAVAWIPGVMWLLDHAWRGATWRTGSGRAVLAGLALSQMVMAGHPQLAFYGALYLFAWFLYRWFGSWSSPASRLRIPALFVVAGVIAVGVAAVTLLPARELLELSNRTDLHYRFTTEFSLLPRKLIALFVPEFLNWSGTEHRIYAGLLTLALAVVAFMVPRPGRRERTFFGVVAIISLLGTLGGFTAFHGWLYRFIPGFDSVRVPARLILLAHLSLAVLAAFGAEAFARRLSRAEVMRLVRLARAGRWIVGFAAIAAVVLFALLVVHFKPYEIDHFRYEKNLPLNRSPAPGDAGLPDRIGQTANAVMLSFVFLLGVVGILWLRARSAAAPRAFVVLMVGFMTLDLATYTPYHDSDRVDPRSQALVFSRHRLNLVDGKARDELGTLRDLLNALPVGARCENHVLDENGGQIWGVLMTTGYNILDLRDRAWLRDGWPPLDSDVWRDLTFTRVMVFPPDVPGPPEPGAFVAFENAHGKLWMREGRPQYACFSTRVRPASDIMAVKGFLGLGRDTYRKQPTVSAAGGAWKRVLSEHWPEALDAGSFAVGRTGVRSPVSISVLAGGPGGHGTIVVDGKTETPSYRSLLVVVIDASTGAVLKAGGFATDANPLDSDRVARWLEAAPEGSIIAFSGRADSTRAISKGLRSQLAILDLHSIVPTRPDDAWAAIVVKGEPAARALCAIGAGPQSLDVGVGAHDGGEGTFTSRLVAFEENCIRLEAVTDRPGLLSIPEGVYPGWEAVVDGKPVTVLHANHGFRAVVVRPGRHDIEFVYRPSPFRTGACISLVSILAAVFMLAAVWFRGRIARRRSSPA